MSALVKVIRGLGWLWMVLAGLLNVAVHIMILKQGFTALQEALNPFNVRHFFTVALTFAPGAVLLMLADAVQQKRGKTILGGLIALPVAVGLVILLGVTAMSYREARDKSAGDTRTTEYKATSVRILNRSAVMNEHRNYGITQTSGAVGQEGIPEVIKLGDVVTVKDRVVRVRHIFVTEIHEDLKWGGKVLAKKGDVHCVAVESEENRPHSDEKRDRLWIYIPGCQPLSRS